MRKKLRYETFLVPSILNKEYSTFIKVRYLEQWFSTFQCCDCFHLNIVFLCIFCFSSQILVFFAVFWDREKACACVYMCTCMLVEARGWYLVSSRLVLRFFVTGSLTDSRAHKLPRLASQWIQGSSCLFALLVLGW